MNSREAEIWINWSVGQIRGLRKVIVLFQASEIFEWESGETKMVLTDHENAVRVNSFIQQLKSSRWLNEDEIPMSEPARHAIPTQLSLTRESGVNVLALKSMETEIVLLLYFDEPSRHFGLTLKEAHFTATSRKIIEQMLTTALGQFVQQQRKQQELEERLLNYQNYLKEKVKQSQEKIRTAEMVHQQNRQALVMQVFRDITIKRQIKASMSKEAKELIASLNEDLNFIQTLLEQILDHLWLVNRTKETWIIEESDVEWVMMDLKKTSTREPDEEAHLPPIGRLTRTRQLLDRYEEAARVAVYHQEEINGKNIARYCNPPVTNASISDALKKHRDRLIELLHTDKDSWPLLRTRFKSLSRIIDRETEKLYTA